MCIRDRAIAMRVRIYSAYKNSIYAGNATVRRPDGQEFIAYCENRYEFGGRNKKFVVASCLSTPVFAYFYLYSGRNLLKSVKLTTSQKLALKNQNQSRLC